MSGITTLNHLPHEEARAAFLRCCGALAWAQAMAAQRPFRDEADLFETADALWQDLDRAAWLEAFVHHPRIGDVEDVRRRFADTRVWAAGEQAGTKQASEAMLEALAEGNRAYEARFGYIFIVCATGKSVREMLALLQARLHNDSSTELRIAAEEQHKITRLRLGKLLQEL